MNTPRTITTALAGILLLAGCTNDPGPAPTITDPRTAAATETSEPEPTMDPTSDAAAIQTFDDFIAAYNKAGQDYYRDANEKVVWYTTGDYRPELSTRLQNAAADGARQTGEMRLSGSNVIDHQPGRTSVNNVTFEVCVDTSEFDVVLPDESSLIDPGTTGKYTATVTMWYTVGDTWQVAQFRTDRGRPC